MERVILMSKENRPISPTDWIHIKFNAYEYSMMKHRREEHKLFKREFINAFLAEQEKRQIQGEIESEERRAQKDD